MDNLSTSKEAIKLGKRAVAAEQAKNYEEAHVLYIKAVKSLIQLERGNFYSDETNQNKKKSYKSLLANLIKRAEITSKILNLEPIDTSSLLNQIEQPDPSQNEESKHIAIIESNSAQTESLITKSPLNTNLSRIFGLEIAKRLLQEAIILPSKYPHLFIGIAIRHKNFLLFGPPGVGKTLLVNACATEASIPFYSVHSSDLISRCISNSEKALNDLFTLACNKTPSIVFVDEIDLICDTGEGEHEAIRRIKNELLVQIERIGNLEIYVMAATNAPWKIDCAIRKRFSKRVFIQLPEESERKRALEKYLESCEHEISQRDFDEFAKLTEGYTVSDILVMVKSGLMEPIRKCQNARYFKKVLDNDVEKFTPCDSSEPYGIEMNFMDVRIEEILPPKSCSNDIYKSIRSMQKTVSFMELDKHYKFNEVFGEE